MFSAKAGVLDGASGAGEKSAAVLPPVAPHACREEVRVCANKRGEVYKVTWRH